MENSIYIKMADRKKCQCAKCVIGFLNGWDNWNCAKYLDGKPREVLYQNQPCEKFKPLVKKEKNNGR